MQNAEFTKVETIALGALKAESQRLQAMNLQFNAAVAEVTKEIESNHSGYTLDHSSLTLVAKPAQILEMPAAKETEAEYATASE